MTEYRRLALLVSDTERAQEAAVGFRGIADWVPIDEADAAVVLGGDGFMLQTLHAMLDSDRVIPVYGLNVGTVGFLMNRNRNPDTLLARIGRAKPVTISPLSMQAITQDGTQHRFCAINEVSLLRETRQTAKIEVSVVVRHGSRNWSATVCFWRPPQARPPTIFPPTARSCRWIRGC